jgi:hypothetical protein
VDILPFLSFGNGLSKKDFMRFLNDKIAEEMFYQIGELMAQYRYNPNGSDNRCAFCGEEERPSDFPQIQHREDCAGIRFRMALSRSHLASNATNEQIDTSGWKTTIWEE